MLEIGLVWQGVVLAAAAERGLLDREELAGEFLAPLSSPQERQGPCQKRDCLMRKNAYLFMKLRIVLNRFTLESLLFFEFL